MVEKLQYNACLCDVMALMQTYDTELFSSAEALRKKIYKDLFNLQKKGKAISPQEKLDKIEFWAVANGGLSAETIIKVVKGEL